MTATAAGHPNGGASYRQRGHPQKQAMSLALANMFSLWLSRLSRSQRHRLPLDGASPVANAGSLQMHGLDPSA